MVAQMELAFYCKKPRREPSSVAVKLFNTDGRAIQDFVAITPGRVGMYTCGLTVYNYAHIGNLRTYLFEDLLRRTLEYDGYTVTHVMNVTDIGHLTDDADAGEDKMVKSAREKGMSVWEIASFYTRTFFEDLSRLNIEQPTVVCRATDHIPEMIALVKRLEERGFTYEAGGNVYYDISKFPEYGRMALLDRQELQSGARIEVDKNKRNPRDFVLWFTSSKFERQVMLWDSPWGRGYPGWHLECSAMSMRYLGEHFDIHCGGVDHIPVHHTNEIAQSEGATGAHWVNYWLHGEFLLLNKEKMAKSAGGFLTLATLMERGYDPLDYRYLCLGSHYRTQLQFSWEALDGARAARLNLVERVVRLREEAASADNETMGAAASAHRREFFENVASDLGTPKAMAVLWALLKAEELPPADKLTAILDMDRILGLGLAQIEGRREEIEGELLTLIREREEERRRKNWERADEIRRLLLERGIAVEDTPKGSRWTRVHQV